MKTTTVYNTLVCFLYLLVSLPGAAQAQETIITASGMDFIQASDPSRSPPSNYNLQLLPGQEFTGYYYFWVNASPGPLTSIWPQEWDADWLIDFEPKTFTRSACEDPVTMVFRFKAPETPGQYALTLTDSTATWNPLYILLTVTTDLIPGVELPFEVDPGKTLPFVDPTNEWTGINGGCNPPFFPGDTQKFKFIIYPEEARDWFRIDKDSLTVSALESENLVWTFAPQSAGELNAYLIKDLEWRSQLAVIKVTVNPGQTTSTVDFENELAYLGQSYPNPAPANNTVSIPVLIKEATNCSFRIYDYSGKLVRSIDAGWHGPGDWNYHLDINNLPAGIYLYQLLTASNGESLGRKLIIGN